MVDFRAVDFHTEEESEISEEELFKFLVKTEQTEMPVLKRNITRFFHRIPINIFKDDYHILYQVMNHTAQYNTYFHLVDIYYIAMNNASEILNNPNITMFSEIDDDDERIERIIISTMNTFDDLILQEDEQDSNRMLANIDIYLTHYVKHALQALNNRVNKMLSGVLTNKHDIPYTVEEVKAYKTNIETQLFGLLDEELDKLSAGVDTGTMTPEEIIQTLEGTELNEIVATTGVAELDAKIGGLRKKEYFTVQAGSGVGKSKFAINMAHNSIISGNDVLFDSIEMPSEKVMARLLAKHVYHLFGEEDIVLELTEKHIEKNRLTPRSREYLARAITDLTSNESYGRLKITDDQVMLEGFEGRLERYWDEGFHFDVYVLDYIGIVGSRDGRYSKTDVVARISNTLKRIVKSFKGVGFGAVVVSQLSREGERMLNDGEEGAKLATADSAEITRDSDFVLTLHQDEAMKVNKQMKFFIDKSRSVDISDGRVFMVDVDLSYNLFYTLE